jgi:aminobenzoyl-glutamate transport protein
MGYPRRGMSHPTPPSLPRGGILDLIERIGNKLPEPILLFILLWAIVVAASAVVSAGGWTVQPVRPALVMMEKLDDGGRPALDTQGRPMMTPRMDESGSLMTELKPAGKPIEAKSLLTVEGVYWMLSSMLGNFTRQPALGLIFVAILGIGLAEKFGLFSALMRAIAIATPKWLLTPVIVFIGANAAVASDAGYLILPPLAAALFFAVGRHPIAGLAAAFAGVSGGFGGGFFPSGGDGALAGFATTAAHIIDSGYTVNITHNLYFKAASSLVICLAGWFVTDVIVEPRLKRTFANFEGSELRAEADLTLKSGERRALVASIGLMGAVLGVFAVMIFVPGMPLHGMGTPTTASGQAAATLPVRIVVPETPGGGAVELFSEPPVRDATGTIVDPGYRVVQGDGRPTLLERPGERWSHAIVPMIFLSFVLPGLLFGWMTGQIRGQQDVVQGLVHGVRSLAPVLAILFFLAQFVEAFKYSHLDKMLAYAGGSLLVSADLPVPLLIVLFVLLVVCADFTMSGMLAKFGVMAPIFIPMFMMVGMSPELTTAAYRIGDSVVNVITPLNSYLLVILGVLMKYKKNAGLGSLMSLMVPYSAVFFVAWTGFLLLWHFAGWPLGPEAPQAYVPDRS